MTESTLPAGASANAPTNADNPAAGIVWDLTDFFPAIDSPAYREEAERLESALPALRAEIEAGIADDAWEEVLERFEQLDREASHMHAYLECLASANARDEEATQERARMEMVLAEQAKAQKALELALAALDDAAFDALTARPALADARFALGRLRQLGRWSMAPELEMLQADLAVDGMGAWGELYIQMAARLTFEMKWPDGRRKRVPMAQYRSLLEHPEAAVRKAAMTGANRAWARMEEPAAACLNRIAGWRLQLQRKRGVEHFLDEACFDGAVERSTIETMWQGVIDEHPRIHDFMRLRARLIGVERIGFQDTAAPLPPSLLDGDGGGGANADHIVSWEEARGNVLDAFGGRYPRLERYAREFLDRGHLEAEKRANKRPGGFCTSSHLIGQSRIFMNYTGTLDDVQTIAHELGHAFHSHVMGDLRELNRWYPMTLAETASTFAEALLVEHLLRLPSTTGTQRLRILNQRLNDACSYLLNIHMRYIFERRFYEERQAGVVPLSRLKQLMREAQLFCFGDALDPEQCDPYFWASKLHFYITSISFYNYPYTFGYLLSQALSHRFAAEGAAFLPAFEDFLRHSGSAGCEEAARVCLGFDLHDESFWTSAMEGIWRDLEAFEELVKSHN